eukprot:TRINITY_DN18720_c0_g1_i1.p1 TRINITY_DN18720_c0_g1~~TRINITY_DN18720_c0_g1_i1.p1  ORF type:complete len:286 (-),score=70.28 TRINITY_DN18720_c0_g1_i1:81-938(-)
MASLSGRDLIISFLLVLNLWQFYIHSDNVTTAEKDSSAAVQSHASPIDRKDALVPKATNKVLSNTITEQEKYYDRKYFNEQRHMGAFAGYAEQYRVRDWIRSTDTVLDFGAGGGFFLNGMKCQRKIAVELNSYALEFMKDHFPDIEQYRFLKDVPDEVADLVTSIHVLEHVEAPVLALRELYNKLKPNGIAIFHVKNEGVHTDRRYNPNDWDQHLYTWNPGLFGNLIAAAGFKVEDILAHQTAWPPNYKAVWNQVGEKEFIRLAEIEGRNTNTWSLVLRARKVPK